MNGGCQTDLQSAPGRIGITTFVLERKAPLRSFLDDQNTLVGAGMQLVVSPVGSSRKSCQIESRDDVI
jgi:hypothetical protein